MGAFLSGRVTYELMAGFWPTADADPASTPFVKEFAPIWRDMPKVVYSRTLTSAGWNTTIAREVVRGEVEGLKARARGDLVRAQDLEGVAIRDAARANHPVDHRAALVALAQAVPEVLRRRNDERRLVIFVERAEAEKGRAVRPQLDPARAPSQRAAPRA